MFFLTFALTYTIYGPISPYLPILLRNLGYNPSMIGILLGVYEGAGIAGPFMFGYFADKWGLYKPSIIIAHFLILFTAFPLAMIRQPLLTALFLAVLSIGIRSIFPLLDAVATINLKNKDDYGKIRAMGSVSYIFIVLFLQNTRFLPPSAPFNNACWIAVFTIVGLASVLIIPSRYTSTIASTPSARGSSAARQSIWSPLLILGLIIIGLSRFAMASINGFFSLFLVEYMHWDVVGYMSALAALSEAPFMYISYKLINRFGALRILVVAALFVSIRLALYALFPVKPGVIAAHLLHSLCYGTFHPAAVAFVASCVPPERRALGMTLYLSLGSGLPTLIGNIIGGYIIEHLGFRVLFGSYAFVPLIAIALYRVIAAHHNRRAVQRW
jgi:PPP family 3-phenylpropionic acid transporter